MQIFIAIQAHKGLTVRAVQLHTVAQLHGTATQLGKIMAALPGQIRSCGHACGAACSVVLAQGLSSLT